MKATKSGSFKPVVLPEPQTTVARCYSLIDIGTVENIYKGKVQGMVHRIFITWELPKLKAVFNEDRGEEPFVISEEFTLSTKENSNLAKLISAWRNKPLTLKEQESYDPTIMVGKTALIQFIHKTKAKYASEQIEKVTNENTNMKIQAIMKRSKDMEMPDQLNPTFIWDWEAIESGETKFDPAKFAKIPNFLKDKIKSSDEYKKHGFEEGQAETATGTAAAASEDAGPVSEDDW